MSSPKHMKVKIYSLGQLLESYFNDFLTRTIISTIIARKNIAVVSLI